MKTVWITQLLVEHFAGEWGWWQEPKRMESQKVGENVTRQMGMTKNWLDSIDINSIDILHNNLSKFCFIYVLKSIFIFEKCFSWLMFLYFTTPWYNFLYFNTIWCIKFSWLLRYSFSFALVFWINNRSCDFSVRSFQTSLLTERS